MYIARAVILFIISLHCNSAYTQVHNCTKSPIESSTHYNGLDYDIIAQMKEFNADSTNTIDIVHLYRQRDKKTFSESFKRVSVKGGRSFLYENKTKKELSKSQTLMLTDLLKDLEMSHHIINCNKKTKEDNLYRIFIKSGGKLIMSLWIDDSFKNTDPDLLGKNAKQIELFESIR